MLARGGILTASNKLVSNAAIFMLWLPTVGGLSTRAWLEMDRCQQDLEREYPAKNRIAAVILGTAKRATPTAYARCLALVTVVRGAWAILEYHEVLLVC